MFVNPVLNHVLEAIVEAHGRPLLVGGCVRDALLGVACKDVDVEVHGLSGDDLAAVLGRFGHVDAVGKSFGVLKLRLDQEYDFSVPRRERKQGRGHQEFAIEVDPSMTVEEACARRDFTINAIAHDPFTHEYLDPFGGRDDLKDRLLRPTSEAFKEDPLRVLRGMQFAARFNMEPTAECVRMAGEVRHEYDSLARERVWIEWEKWAAKGLVPSKGLEFLGRCGWLAIYPEIAALADCTQDPEFHPEGDVFRHTLHVLDAMQAICQRKRIEGEDRLVLMLAALCHDFGKPSTTEFFDGHWRSHGHCEAGVPLAEEFLNSIGCLSRITVRVLPLVAEHLVHVRLDHTPRSLRRLTLRLHPATLRELVLLIEADNSGRPPLPPGLPEEAQALLDQGERLALAADKPKPILMGRHLIELGIAPGPPMGAILKRAFEAQLDGAFANVEDGVEWLRRQELV